MPARNVKLTEAEIRNAKPKGMPYRLYDQDGLTMLVRPSGTKVWQYRYKLFGRANVFTIGRYPDIGAADARQQRSEARRLIDAGIAPVETKATHKLEVGDRNSLAAIGHAWFEKQIWTDKHAANIKRQLERDLFQHIGVRPIRAITRQELLGVLQLIEDRGALDVAKRTAQHCVQMFDFALTRGQCDHNPAIGLSKVLKNYRPKHRAYLKEDQLSEFLRGLEGYHGSEKVKLAMKLLMLTFVRPGELRGARWEEFNIAKAEWRIPAERMKMKREHIVPLSPQALAVLERLRPLTGSTDLLFPGNDATKPISDVTLTKCLAILGYGGVATPHGMRSTASTILNENGFNSDWIERQLAHAPKNKIRAAYNRAEYLEQRREMMQWWGERLGQRMPA